MPICMALPPAIKCGWAILNYLLKLKKIILFMVMKPNLVVAKPSVMAWHNQPRLHEMKACWIL